MAKDRTKAPFSLRLERSILARLREQAERTGVAQSSLAERYIDEGMRRDEHPLIVFRETGADRRAPIAGTRLDVWQVIETIRQNGNSPAAANASTPNVPRGPGGVANSSLREACARRDVLARDRDPTTGARARRDLDLRTRGSSLGTGLE